MKDALCHAVRVVALLNLAYFGVEFSVALLIGSVSLFADSIDFLEDAPINALILLALAWSAPRRAVVSKVLAGIILNPGFATVWMDWQKFGAPMPPAIAMGGIQMSFFVNSSGAYPYIVFHAEALRLLQKAKVSRGESMALRCCE